MCCKYVNIYSQRFAVPVLLDDWGPNGPHFKNPSQGVFYLLTTQACCEQDRAATYFRPMVHIVYM